MGKYSWFQKNQHFSREREVGDSIQIGYLSGNCTAISKCNLCQFWCRLNMDLTTFTKVYSKMVSFYINFKIGKVYTDVTISNIANINICRACMETGQYAWQCLNICLAVGISDRGTKKYMRISVLADCLFTVNIEYDEPKII